MGRKRAKVKTPRQIREGLPSIGPLGLYGDYYSPESRIRHLQDQVRDLRGSLRDLLAYLESREKGRGP